MIRYECRYWHEWDWDEWLDKPIPEGFRAEMLIFAASRGKAKAHYVRELKLQGYDPVWTERFSIRKERETGAFES